MADWDNIATVQRVGGAEALPTTNELKVDMHAKQYNAFPGVTPLVSILTRLEDSPAHNYQIDWIEQNEIPTSLVVAQTEASAGTTIYVVDGGKTLVKDTLLYNPRTNDLRLVDGNETDNTITVTVDQGGTTSSVWRSGDVIHVLLPSIAENDDVTSSSDDFRTSSVENSRQYNYQQLCKLQFALTRTLDRQSTHFGGPGSIRERLKQQKYREFRIKHEKLCYFGGRSTGGTAPATKRQAGGLNHFLRDGTLFKNFNGVFTESGWDNFLGNYQDQNPDAEKVIALVAPNVKRQIGYWAKDRIRMSPMAKEYGIDIVRYGNAGFTVDIATLPLLTDDVTSGWGFLLDLQRIRMKQLDRATFFPDAKNVGQSEIIYDTYRVQTSMMIANESRHAMFVGADL